MNRIQRERKTIEAMIRLYCRKNHGNEYFCHECKALAEYASKKLDKCPFSPDKPVCIDCKVHCYQKEQREQIRQIMRFSGPKMIFRHPILAVFHIIDKKRNRNT